MTLLCVPTNFFAYFCQIIFWKRYLWNIGVDGGSYKRFSDLLKKENMQSSLSIPKGLGPGATIIPKAAEAQIPKSTICIYFFISLNSTNWIILYCSIYWKNVCIPLDPSSSSVYCSRVNLTHPFNYSTNIGCTPTISDSPSTCMVQIKLSKKNAIPAP